MNIYYKENVLTGKDFAAFQRKMGWKNEREDILERAISNGLYNVVALNDDEVIGFGRLVGDSAMYWYVQDVFVLNEYQGFGVGKKIVEKLISHIKSNSPKGTSVDVGLMSADGKEEFYEKFGFKRCPNENQGHGMLMEIEIK